MRLLIFTCLLSFFQTANAQTFDLHYPFSTKKMLGNRLFSNVRNSCGIWDGGQSIGFQTPFVGDSTNTVWWAINLWLAGFDQSGNLKFSAETYPTANAFDYAPGLVDHSTFLKIDSSEWHFDKIWSCRRWQIEQHRADFQDNGQIDQPISDIIGWPGAGNPFFKQVNGFELPANLVGWAPFFDENMDGVFNPFEGDFPLPENVSPNVLPEQILWWVLSDAGFTATGAANLPVEIQLTTWVFHCPDNPILAETAFTNHKITLVGTSPLDSVSIGFWNNTDMSCSGNGLSGSEPLLGSVFSYVSSDSLTNGNQFGCFSNRQPALGMLFLNQPMNSFYVYGTPFTGNSPDYQTWQKLNYRLGTSNPNFYPGGCNPGNVDTLHFMFPGDPLDPASCAMNHFFDTKSFFGGSIASLFKLHWQPNEALKIDLAWAFARDTTSPDSLASLALLQNWMPQIRDFYQNQFENACQPPVLCQNDCVWPGDVNLDGIANHCDLLDMALASASGQTSGPVRTPREVWWSPWSADAWPGAIPGNGQNTKHADADGNGLLRPDDFEITAFNFGETQTGWLPMADVFPIGPELSFQPLNPPFPLTNLQPNAFRAVKINLNPPPDLFGLAFEVDFDSRYIRTGHFQNFQQPEKWNSTTFYNPLFSDGSAPTAVAKSTAAESFSVGQLGLFTFNMAPFFPEPIPDTLRLRFKNIKGIRADGSEISLGGMEIFMHIKPGVPTDEPFFSEKMELEIFPNPTNGSVFVKRETAGDARLAILNTLGQVVLQQNTTDLIPEISLEGLPPGFYLLKMESQSQIGAGRFLKN